VLWLACVTSRPLVYERLIFTRDLPVKSGSVLQRARPGSLVPHPPMYPRRGSGSLFPQLQMKRASQPSPPIELESKLVVSSIEKDQIGH